MTLDRAPILSALQGLTAEGPTSLNDAAFLALQLRATDTADSRPVVLVFSDGADSSSLLSSDEVPEGVSREGWHDVRVSVKKTKGMVTARPGYLRASMVGTS